MKKSIPANKSESPTKAKTTVPVSKSTLPSKTSAPSSNLTKTTKTNLSNPTNLVTKATLRPTPLKTEKITTTTPSKPVHTRIKSSTTILTKSATKPIASYDNIDPMSAEIDSPVRKLEGNTRTANKSLTTVSKTGSFKGQLSAIKQQPVKSYEQPSVKSAGLKKPTQKEASQPLKTTIKISNMQPEHKKNAKSMTCDIALEKMTKTTSLPMSKGSYAYIKTEPVETTPSESLKQKIFSRIEEAKVAKEERKKRDKTPIKASPSKAQKSINDITPGGSPQKMAEYVQRLIEERERGLEKEKLLKSRAQYESPMKSQEGRSSPLRSGSQERKPSEETPSNSPLRWSVATSKTSSPLARSKSTRQVRPQASSVERERIQRLVDDQKGISRSPTPERAITPSDQLGQTGSFYEKILAQRHGTVPLRKFPRYRPKSVSHRNVFVVSIPRMEFIHEQVEFTRKLAEKNPNKFSVLKSIPQDERLHTADFYAERNEGKVLPSKEDEYVRTEPEMLHVGRIFSLTGREMQESSERALTKSSEESPLIVLKPTYTESNYEVLTLKKVPSREIIDHEVLMAKSGVSNESGLSKASNDKAPDFVMIDSASSDNFEVIQKEKSQSAGSSERIESPIEEKNQVSSPDTIIVGISRENQSKEIQNNKSLTEDKPFVEFASPTLIEKDQVAFEIVEETHNSNIKPQDFVGELEQTIGIQSVTLQGSESDIKEVKDSRDLSPSRSTTSFRRPTMVSKEGIMIQTNKISDDNASSSNLKESGVLVKVPNFVSKAKQNAGMQGFIKKAAESIIDLKEVKELKDEKDSSPTQPSTSFRRPTILSKENILQARKMDEDASASNLKEGPVTSIKAPNFVSKAKQSIGMQSFIQKAAENIIGTKEVQEIKDSKDSSPSQTTASFRRPTIISKEELTLLANKIDDNDSLKEGPATLIKAPNFVSKAKQNIGLQSFIQKAAESIIDLKEVQEEKEDKDSSPSKTTTSFRRPTIMSKEKLILQVSKSADDASSKEGQATLIKAPNFVSKAKQNVGLQSFIQKAAESIIDLKEVKDGKDSRDTSPSQLAASFRRPTLISKEPTLLQTNKIDEVSLSSLNEGPATLVKVPNFVSKAKQNLGLQSFIQKAAESVITDVKGVNKKIENTQDQESTRTEESMSTDLKTETRVLVVKSNTSGKKFKYQKAASKNKIANEKIEMIVENDEKHTPVTIENKTDSCTIILQKDCVEPKGEVEVSEPNSKQPLDNSEIFNTSLRQVQS